MSSTPDSTRGPAGPQDQRHRGGPETRVMAVLVRAESLMLYVVAVLLIATAAILLVAVIIDVAREHEPWTIRVVDLFEGLLLVVIVVEIYATVLIGVQRRRFRLEPFLVIGVIASIRHILSVGVELALGPYTGVETRAQLIDLSVNAAIVFLLVIGVVAVRWSDRWA